MPGIVRTDAGPVDLPGDADLRRGSLFRSVFGSDPVTPGEKLMAEALDAQGSDAGNTESNARVCVVRIIPVPGAGIVRGGAFIPEDEVWNPLYSSMCNRGDGRGFDPNAGPDDARMSFDIDYENGIVVVRQIASVTTDGGSTTGLPDVGVEQDASGRTRLRFEGTDPYADPATWAAGTTVRGDVIVDPRQGAGPASVNGRISQFPNIEVYQDRGGSTGAPLLQNRNAGLWVENKLGVGPLANVGLPTMPVGDDPGALDDWRARYHPNQSGPSPVASVFPTFLPIGAKITDDFWNFPVANQPYPVTGADGRVQIPSADQVR